MALEEKLTAEDVIERLGLKPLPLEGGFFRGTYKADGHIPEESLPAGTGGPRAFSTAIYYLLTPETFSAIHRLPWDEVFHFYLGDPVEMLLLFPEGSGRKLVLGAGLEECMAPQAVVPAGVWQGCRLRGGGKWALMGTTVAPGFEFRDYEEGKREELLRLYPAFREEIMALTRMKGGS